MLEKANVATKILLAGSLLWVGTMVVRSDQNLKKALSEIGEAKQQINEAKSNIDSARLNINTVTSDLVKLSNAATVVSTELRKLQEERGSMKRDFDNMISKSKAAMTTAKANLESTRETRLNLLKEIKAMNLDREKKSE